MSGASGAGRPRVHPIEPVDVEPGSGSSVKLFLCGDVMTGRGVDQILPYPSDPRIYEDYAQSAEVYVQLAERASGPIPRPVEFRYIWGDALDALARERPDARIINLETSVTRSEDYARDKAINYRMHPDNIRCIAVAGIDCCVLANNHVLDFGRAGLLETLDTLARAGLALAGAGRNLAEAEAPAVIAVPGKGRVVVFGLGAESSGIPRGWAATDDRPGVNLLEDLSGRSVARCRDLVRRLKRPRDIVIASIHWGDNWGYAVPESHVRFAHDLIRAGVDLVHGHSSHHVRPIEVFEGKLILYGCGDFLDDYEGISGYEEFRDDLAVMYFPAVDAVTGRLLDLRMTPLCIRQFRVNRATREDATWLRDTLDRESRKFGVRVDLDGDHLHLDLGPRVAPRIL